ncbi:MAG TPA: thioredoxin domain-containing protein, partial [Phycisphaerae bacterium]
MSRTVASILVGAVAMTFTSIWFIGRQDNAAEWAPNPMSTNRGYRKRYPRLLKPALIVVAVLLLSISAAALVFVLEHRHPKLAPTASAESLSATPDQSVPPADVSLSESAATSAPIEARPRGFTGRYRLGAEAAPIRLVMFADYQCKFCRQVELDIRQIMDQRSDVSFSVKHFPLCPDCNRTITEANAHPLACLAARAAETAGILRGNRAFWQMHFWLVEHGEDLTSA